MGTLTSEMKRLVQRQRLGFVATVCPDGTPNLSPKGTTDVWDDDHLVFADIRSPGTIANLRHNPSIEINVVDPILRKGYRFKGIARVLAEGALFDEILAFFRKRGVASPIQHIVLIRVERALPLTSPAYDSGATEEEVRGRWLEYWRSLEGDDSIGSTIQSPVASAQMLIRKPSEEVFRALVDPAITSRFWFTKGSAPLEAGTQVRWDWEMYGASVTVEVKELEENKRILFEWNGPANPSFVEWDLAPRGRDQTFVKVRNWGFAGGTDKIVADAIGSAGGFSFVLAALKAFLEHGIELNLIADHDPDALVEGWAGQGGHHR